MNSSLADGIDQAHDEKRNQSQPEEQDLTVLQNMATVPEKPSPVIHFRLRSSWLA